MLSKLFKKRKLQIYVPVNGEIVSLEQVPDQVQSNMMGEGIAIMPEKGNIHAPVEGTVVLYPIQSTRLAFVQMMVQKFSST